MLRAQYCSPKTNRSGKNNSFIPNIISLVFVYCIHVSVKDLRMFETKEPRNMTKFVQIQKQTKYFIYIDLKYIAAYEQMNSIL